jgi:Uma2 family endonuclease
MMSAAAIPGRLQISVERYLKMASAGVLTHEDRVELIEGEILKMPPLGTQHSGITGRLNKLLVLAVGDTAILLPGPTLPLGPYSAPQPDLVLLKPREDFYSHGYPLPSDVLLLIEIADSSLAYEQGVKRTIYARAGIAEYWVVDVGGHRLIRHRNPTGDGYSDVVSLADGDVVVPHALPQVAVPVGTLFI